ncbi:helix-turn-helix domain-containing protein [Mycolicibacterium elephantis]
MQTQTFPAAESGQRRWSSLKGAAKHAGVSVNSIRAYIEDGRLTAYRLGPKLVRIDLDELDHIAMRPYSKESDVERDLTARAESDVLDVIGLQLDRKPQDVTRLLNDSPVPLRLHFAALLNITVFLLRLSDRPTEMLAALRQRVTAAPTD